MMTPTAAFAEIEARQIALTPAFDGKVWMASVDLKGEDINRKRSIRSLTATALTPSEAVDALVAKLDGEARERELFED